VAQLAANSIEGDRAVDVRRELSLRGEIGGVARTSGNIGHDSPNGSLPRNIIRRSRDEHSRDPVQDVQDQDVQDQDGEARILEIKAGLSKLHASVLSMEKKDPNRSQIKADIHPNPHPITISPTLNLI